MTSKYKPLPPLTKKLWVDSLRSGNFTQGTLYLEKDGLNCCLGVLCRIKGINASLVKSLFGESCYAFGFQGHYSYLDDDTVDILGLDHNAVPVLIKMNDKDGASFDYIATWIETHL